MKLLLKIQSNCKACIVLARNEAKKVSCYCMCLIWITVYNVDCCLKGVNVNSCVFYGVVLYKLKIE